MRTLAALRAFLVVTAPAAAIITYTAKGEDALDVTVSGIEGVLHFTRVR